MMSGRQSNNSSNSTTSATTTGNAETTSRMELATRTSRGYRSNAIQLKIDKNNAAQAVIDNSVAGALDISRSIRNMHLAAPVPLGAQRSVSTPDLRLAGTERSHLVPCSQHHLGRYRSPSPARGHSASPRGRTSPYPLLPNGSTTSIPSLIRGTFDFQRLHPRRTTLPIPTGDLYQQLNERHFTQASYHRQSSDQYEQTQAYHPVGEPEYSLGIQTRPGSHNYDLTPPCAPSAMSQFNQAPYQQPQFNQSQSPTQPYQQSPIHCGPESVLHNNYDPQYDSSPTMRPHEQDPYPLYTFNLSTQPNPQEMAASPVSLSPFEHQPSMEASSYSYHGYGNRQSEYTGYGINGPHQCPMSASQPLTAVAQSRAHRASRDEVDYGGPQVVDPSTTTASLPPPPVIILINEHEEVIRNPTLCLQESLDMDPWNDLSMYLSECDQRTISFKGTTSTLDLYDAAGILQPSLF